MKCDETKPKCSWCAKTGKDCIYETTDPSFKDPNEASIASTRPMQPKNAAVPRLNLNLVQGGKREKKGFYFYVTQLGPMLSGNCDREFWTRILCQTSCVDPAVWHSVMAVSMLQQHSLSRSTDADGKDLLYYSLQHYNKAVELLTKPALGVQVRSETLIISCAVFACIEVMLGDIESSRKHILSGVKIISDWKLESFRAPAYQRTLMEGHMEPIFDNLGVFFIFLFKYTCKLIHTKQLASLRSTFRATSLKNSNKTRFSSPKNAEIHPPCPIPEATLPQERESKLSSTDPTAGFDSSKRTSTVLVLLTSK